ncbi:hypothetical protein [Candidatus Poriferisodalis sp.]|uniref:hypothetical protein n=1 Tax=Candidatus Poriferisodalis sp. TaxID=3101277 RepID=UPI003B01EF35
MSEEDRSRLYAWFREQLDERRAEYMMSCLAPAPLSDLVTKEHLERVLSSAFSEFALNLSDQREADRKEMADQREADRNQREADRKQIADQREADRKEREAERREIADEREADRQEARKRHRWLVGIAVVLALEIVAAEAGWLQPLTDLLTAAS